MTVLSSCQLGIQLLARVFAGQCPDVADSWSTQRCNPFADAGAIPFELVIFIYLVPLLAQCCLRGVSAQCLFLTSALGLAFVVGAFAYFGGSPQIWIISFFGFFANITYVIERLMRVNFNQGLVMAAADRMTIERESALRDVLSQNEVKMKETEIFQLRSLMGNVAHDIKTPLHSLEADIEVLSVFVKGIPDLDLQAARAKQVSGVPFDPQSVFNSLNATCKFMAMAINRSQDFIKASNNIALVPAMETFNLSKALAMSVTCIRHLEGERSITVHPFGDDISSHVISDKHWLSENVLCLLSNALKYSDDGAVDVRLKVVRVYDPIAAPPATRDEQGGEDGFKGGLKDMFINGFNSGHNDKGGGSDVGAEGEERTASDDSSSVRRRLPFLDQYPELKKISTDSATEFGWNSCCDVPEEAKTLMLLLTVEDHGIGIPEEARSNLFQPFQPARRMAGGTGLGLYSISKRIEALGGKCGVTGRSDKNQGSKFWFTFPYRPDESALTDTATDVSVPCVPAVEEVRPSRILVVDDSLSIMKVTSRLLKMNGHLVDTASNGSIGLKMLKEAPHYDMVLTDLQMPVMDGIEATERFRKFEEEIMQQEERDEREAFAKGVPATSVRRKKLLIVGMSANSDTRSKQIALNAGMDYFVSKPFSYKDLKPMLCSV